MVVESKGYNVAKVVTGKELKTSEDVVIGTLQDYQKLRELVSNSGLMRVVTGLDVSGTKMSFDGTCIANLWSDGIEFSTIVWNGEDDTAPKIVGGQLYMDDNSLKCAINYYPVGSTSSAKSKK